MTKKIIIIGAIVIVTAAIWWLAMFFQEKESEKQVSQSPVTLNINKEEKLKGEYSWGTAAGPNQAQYKDAIWQPITASILAGFSPADAAMEKQTEDCQGFGETVLRAESCMCQTGYWVEITKGGQVEKIDTEMKLKSALLPIDSADKAVSLVMLTKRDLYIDHDVPVGHILLISDGYLVQVVDLNTCGCSTHETVGTIYKVTKSGEITQIAAEIVPPGEGPEICVD